MRMGNSSAELTAGERLLAGLGQLFGLWGAPVVLLINWGRSRYVSYQAVQSILFSLTVFAVQVLVIACLGVMLIWGLATGGVPDSAMADTGESSGPGMILAALSLMGFGAAMPVLTGISVFSWIARIIAALVCFSGGVFRYPILSRLAGRYPA
jgi:uncharacterized membrane protein